MQKVDISVLGKEDAISLISKQWMLVTAGNAQKFNTMTASWGGIGFLWNRPVAMLFIRPERFTHQFIEENDRLTLTFFPEECRKALQICGSKSGRDCDKVAEAGLTPVATPEGQVSFAQARMTLVCRKLFKTTMEEANFIDKEIFANNYNPNPGGGLHSVFIVEIESVYA